MQKTDTNLSQPEISKPAHSYGQILKSSSIIGGAQGINYVIGMVRTKIVAVLLGPEGVGLVGLYVSATGLVDTVARLGIDTSGVREVAEAHGSNKAEQIARTVKTLRRMCWLTGIFGWILTAALSYPLSLWTFGSGERAWAIAILGATVLIGAVSGGQSCLIQGTRRIGDLARMNVFGAVVSTVIAVGLYAWLGQKGIVPVIIATAATTLGFSWWFARKIPVADVTLNWAETFKNSRRLIHLGVAFMYGALLAAVVGLTIRALIVRKLGLDAAGIYQAAWALSGMFAGFIISAMGTDFYPRLTAVAKDNEQVNRLVNEQTEIGILLALPGLLGTLTFAPWIMHFFYSPKFLSGAELLPFLVVGVIFQVITFPAGMIQMAKGANGWIYFGRTEGNVVQLFLTVFLVSRHGILGVALAFPLFTFIHGVVAFLIARRLSNYSCSKSVMRLVLLTVGFIGVAFLILAIGRKELAVVCSVFVTGLACFFSLRGISARLGTGNRAVRMVLKLPGGRAVCGL